MKASDGKLTPRQEAAIAALLSHGTVKAAAQAVGVSEVTFWRWMQLTEFQALYRAARTSAVDSAIGLMQKACTGAVGTLVKVMAAENAPASARVSAARVVIEQSLRAVELMDLQERIERLEQQLESQDKGKANRWG